MSDTSQTPSAPDPATATTEQQPTTSTPAPGPVPPAPASGDAALGEAGQRALAAEREQRKALEAEVATLKPLAEQAQALEDAKKSEVERLTEAAATAAAERDKASREAMQMQAALAAAPAGMAPKQISDLAARLQGDNLEALTEDAKALFALVPAPPQRPGSSKPIEQLQPGALPTTGEAPIQDQIAAAQAAGNKDLVMRLKAQMLLNARPAANG